MRWIYAAFRVGRGVFFGGDENLRDVEDAVPYGGNFSAGKDKRHPGGDMSLPPPLRGTSQLCIQKF